MKRVVGLIMLGLLILAGLGLVGGAWALYRRLARGKPAPDGPRSVFICRHCGEQHCECQKTE